VVRRRRARRVGDLVRALDVDAILIWSRSGGAVDQLAGV